MYDYIIGIDGGGTKTLGVVYDYEGNELKRIQVGFSNFSVNVEKSKKTIMELIMKLVSGIGKEKKVFIQMGVAGASRLSDTADFLREIEEQFDCKASLDVDATIGLYAIEKTRDESLIMAIGGTGSVIMIEHENEINRLGGWGHILGDGGSAYHFVIAALKQLIDEYETKSSFSVMSERLIKVIGLKNPKQLVEYVYNTDKSTLAQLSLEIQDVSNRDPKVKELLIAEGKTLAEQIIKAYKVYVKKGPVVVALRGSFALKALYVNETILAEVNKAIPNVRFDLYGREPVYGAYVLAKKKIEGDL